MGVDQTSLDRIRNATFPSSKRGYDKQEVEKFLARLADWLETGAGDESRSETVKRELERVGERTGAILAQAEDSAQQIRTEADEEAREVTSSANAASEQTRGEADSYSEQTHASADAYADQTRREADGAAATTRSAAEQDARQKIAEAEAQARRIVDEGTRRREDIEAVIADLVRRRDDVLADTEELSARLSTAAADHRPAKGADPFEKPEELDPLQRDEDAEGDSAAGADEHLDGDEDVGFEGEEDAIGSADDVDDEPSEAEASDYTAEAPAKPKRGSRRTRA